MSTWLSKQVRLGDLPRACVKCGETKPATEFYKRDKGRRRECKQCWHQQNRGRKCDMDGARRYWEKFPEKRLATAAVGNAIRDGRLERPEACWHCGGEKPQAHHVSYAEDMRLAVTWLCRPCHREVHQMN